MYLRICAHLLFLPLAMGCSFSSGDRQGESSVKASHSSEWAFDFNTGESFGFSGLFRDVPLEKLERYEALVKAGASLGPVPPKTETMLGSREEDSHWFMNAGVYPVADHPGTRGFLLQGVNRSDDMDKYMVRRFDSADGIAPHAEYEVQFLEFAHAANDTVGTFGPGGSPARSISAILTSIDPFPFRVDDVRHVRFRNDANPLSNPQQRLGLGSTGMCQRRGSFQLPHVPVCPNGPIPFLISAKSDLGSLRVKSDSEGRFWLMIGGHSGHESLDEYYVLRLRLSISVVSP